jgi:UDP-N-acetylmuramate--alanine ligase
MTLDQANSMYFIGIGGIGMSALARYFYVEGKQVAGYDRTPSQITEDLVKMGIEIHFEDDRNSIDSQFLNPEDTLVIYTPAVPESHDELSYFRSNGFEVMKRAQVLGLITRHTFCLAIAGTHGKTTTSSILGHLLKECNVELTAFLGGISENYGSNLILHGHKVSVVEADEFDRSFLTLTPDYACITSMDADHLDIYGNPERLIESFRAFAKCLKPDGKLFVKKGLPIQGITYAVDDHADYTATNIKIENGHYVFDVITPHENIENIRFNLPGRHNLSNALIALAMAVEFGCSPYSLVRALASYKGVKRRFTYHIQTDKLILIDDYAHHPKEIDAVYQAVREMYPDKDVLVVFQPHLFSRTKDFGNEFAESLSRFDAVLLLDIYPARELPIEGIDSLWLLKKIKNSNKKLIMKSEIVSEIRYQNPEIVVTLGAGDIGAEIPLIIEELNVAS